MGSPRVAWIAGSALVALLVAAAAWFLALSPALSAVAETRDETEAAQMQNDIQRTKLATLEKQFAELDTYRAELAAIQKQIPAEDAEPALLREIHAVAAEAGVTVLQFTVTEEPSLFFAAEQAATETATADGSEESAEGTDAEAPVGVNGFVRIPVDITVIGAYPSAVSMVAGLQERLDRLFLVTGLSAEGQDEAEAANGKPAVREGDVEMVISGYVYVLQEDAAAPEPESGAATDSSGSVDS